MAINIAFIEELEKKSHRLRPVQAKIRVAIIYLATPQECPPTSERPPTSRVTSEALKVEAPPAAAEVAPAAARGAAAPELAILRFQLFLFFVSHFRFMIIIFDLIVTVVHKF